MFQVMTKDLRRIPNDGPSLEMSNSVSMIQVLKEPIPFVSILYCYNCINLKRLAVQSVVHQNGYIDDIPHFCWLKTMSQLFKSRSQAITGLTKIFKPNVSTA